MKPTALLLFTALGLSTFAIAQEPATRPVRAGQTEPAARQADEMVKGQLAKCSTLQSTAVQITTIEGGERQMEKVADFSDLILDGQTGEARYVVLSRGGIGSIGNTLTAIPVDQLSAKWEMEEGEKPSVQLLTELTTERIAEAPEFSEDAWKLGEDAWRTELDSFFAEGVEGRIVDAGSKADAGAREAGMKKLGLVRLSEIIDVDVKDTAGEKLANIDDIVLDPSNMQIAYLVVGSGGVLGIGEELRAIAPSTLIHHRDEEGQLLSSTRLTQAQLEAAPAFVADDWKMQGTRAFADRIEAAAMGDKKMGEKEMGDKKSHDDPMRKEPRKEPRKQ